MTDVFISYAREDTAFVDRLVAALEAAGKDAWVDRESIPGAAEWRKEIQDGIDGADAFVAVLTPDWTESGACNTEAVYAKERNKRIVPLHVRDVDDSKLPDVVSSHNWIDFADDRTLDAQIAQLVKVIETDLPHVKAHTQWLGEALDWERKDRDKSLLLRGSALAEAEAWLASAPGKDPPPTREQTELVAASRVAATRRQRRLVVTVLGVLGVTVALAVVALFQRQNAIEGERNALGGSLRANASLKLEEDPELAVLLAAESAERAPSEASTEMLRTALVERRQRWTVREEEPVDVALITPDGSRAVATAGGRATLLDAASGKAIKDLGTVTTRDQVSLSGDGELVAVGLDEGAVTVNATSDGAEKHRFSFGNRKPTALAFARGRHVLAASGIGGVDLFDADAGRRLDRFAVCETCIPFSVSLTPQATRLAAVIGRQTADNDTDLRGVTLWDTARRRVVREEIDREFAPAAVTFGGRGGVLVVNTTAAERGAGFRLVDGRTGAPLRPLPADTTAVAFSNDEKLVAIAGAQLLTVRKWPSFGLETAEPTPGVRSMVFSGNSFHLAVAQTDQTVQVVSFSGLGDPFTLRGHRGAVNAVAVDNFATRIVTGGGDRTVRAWAGVRALPASVANDTATGTSIAIDREGARLATVGEAGKVWSLPGPKPGVGLAPAGAEMTEPEWSADGRRILAHPAPPALDNGELGESPVTPPTAVLWDAGSGEIATRLGGGLHGVWSAHLSPEGDVAVTTGDDGAAVLSSASDGRRLHGLTGHTGIVRASAFSPDGKRVATAGEDGVRLWEVESGQQVWEAKTDVPVRAVAFAPDGRTLVSGGEDGVARAWNAGDGKPGRTFEGHGGTITTIVFAPDGRRFATGARDTTARVWDLRTGAEVLEVPYIERGSTQEVRGSDGRVVVEIPQWDVRLAFTADGERLLTIGGPLASGGTRLWRVDDGLQILSVGTVGNSAALTPDGEALLVPETNRLATYACGECAADDGLLDLAQERTARSLSGAEQDVYLNGEAPEFSGG